MWTEVELIVYFIVHVVDMLHAQIHTNFKYKFCDCVNNVGKIYLFIYFFYKSTVVLKNN